MKTEAELAEEWAELAKAERKAVKKRDGTIPRHSKNQYTAEASSYNPDMDKTRSYNPKRFEDICRLRAEGKSNRKIAEILNVSDTSIRYWRRRYKIE
jgi:DNA-binding NarL/FixJ family response regulator